MSVTVSTVVLLYLLGVFLNYTICGVLYVILYSITVLVLSLFWN